MTSFRAGTGNARLALALVVCLGCSCDQSTQPVTVGSKLFTESVILGEVATQLIRDTGVAAGYRRELGGTRILWNALLSGDIDIYPEYTGTLSNEIFADRDITSMTELAEELGRYNVAMSAPLGFNNTYILGVAAETAENFRLRTISDLRNYPDLRLGFSNEFLDRGDGWRALRQHYDLPHEQISGLDHDLSYRGLAGGDLDVIDLYSTDAEIAYYNITPLDDDLAFFPEYQAMYVYRKELAEKHPGLIETLAELGGTIDEARMSRMNSRVKIGKETESAVASDLLSELLSIEVVDTTLTAVDRFWRNTREHLILVSISLGAALIIAVPLGIIAFDYPRAGQIILGVVSILQTVPSLALFVFLIPVLGIGAAPAVVALFLYSLLPVVRNTYSGLHDIPAAMRESAEALGLPRRTRLLKIELPLATRSILAGVKTAAVINVGTATIAALIGAGGYGQPILTGIRLDDTGLILQGAIPAAALALLVPGLFEILERTMLPRGLRYDTERRIGN